MTKKELLEKLKEYPDDYLIIMSNDSEGNSFSPLHIIESARYMQDYGGYGDIFHSTDEEFIEEGYTQSEIDDINERCVKSIVFYPVC
jgi:hypothetical protein